VNARDDISVTANAKDAVLSVVAGAGGGTVGVAGSVSVTILNAHTFASPVVGAGGDVLILASDDTKSSSPGRHRPAGSSALARGQRGLD
jgi:hypothetical protein